jgi:hypothetical protein
MARPEKWVKSGIRISTYRRILQHRLSGRQTFGRFRSKLFVQLGDATGRQAWRRRRSLVCSRQVTACPTETSLSKPSGYYIFTRTGDYRRGFGMDIAFSDHLYTQLLSTSIYRAIVTLQNSQISTATVKLFQPAVSSPAVAWQRLLTVEILQLYALESSLHRLPYRTDLVAPIVFLITPRHGVSNSNSIVGEYSLPWGRVYPAVAQKRSLFTESQLSNGSIRHNIYDLL